MCPCEHVCTRVRMFAHFYSKNSVSTFAYTLKTVGTSVQRSAFLFVCVCACVLTCFDAEKHVCSCACLLACVCVFSFTCFGGKKWRSLECAKCLNAKNGVCVLAFTCLHANCVCSCVCLYGIFLTSGCVGRQHDIGTHFSVWWPPLQSSSLKPGGPRHVRRPCVYVLTCSGCICVCVFDDGAESAPSPTLLPSRRGARRPAGNSSRSSALLSSPPPPRLRCSPWWHWWRRSRGAGGWTTHSTQNNKHLCVGG